MSMPGGHPGQFPQHPGPQPGPGRPGAAPPAAKAPKRGRRGRDNSGAPVTKRVISSNRRLAIICAVGVAALLGVLLMTSNKVDGLYVVRAARPIAAASTLQPSQVEAILMDEAYIAKGSFTGATAEEAIDKAMNYSEGKIVQYPLEQRAQITKSVFAGEANLGQPLAADERLLSVRASAAAAANGTIKPGDHVDVVLFSGDLAGMVASDVEVVGVTVGEQELSSASSSQLDEQNRDKDSEELLPGAPIPGTYLLRVKMHQLTPLAAADGDSSGRLFLAVRGADAANAATVPLSVISAICGRGMTAEDLGPTAGVTVQMPAECAAAALPATTAPTPEG